MDSDNDDNFGYGIPVSGGRGFHLSSEVGFNYSSHEDDSVDNDDARKFLGSSSDEGVDEDNPNFAYGSKKRRHREGKPQPSEKERNLYGVFYDSDSDNDAAGRGRFKNSKARHFEKGQNRLAGLAFVKASTTASDDKHKELSAELNFSDAEKTPAWLNDETQGRAFDDNLAEFKSRKVETSTQRASEDENSDTVIDDTEMKLVNDCEVRFKELLAQSQNTKLQACFMDNRKSLRVKKTAGKVKKIVGSGLLNKNYDVNNEPTISDIGDGTDTQMLTGHGSTSSYVFDETRKNRSDANNIYSRDELISNGAGLRSVDQNGFGIVRNNIMMNHGSADGLGLAEGDEKFGERNIPSLSDTMGIGFQRLGINSTITAKKRDPSLGKWESHTKGIGMKLLAKMGYAGSGGLGAKRRRTPVDSSNSTDYEQDNKRDSTHAKTASSLRIEQVNAKTIATNEEEGAVKKGISRPVEVVVRPAGLGLGYGTFKEATQLKVNREIEAEVRGLDPATVDSSQKDALRDIYHDKSLVGIPKSLLPSTQTLLTKGSQLWRTGGKDKKTKRKIINYQDILKHKTEKIIDMRGPGSQTTSLPDESRPISVLLGEELLHNVTLLLNNYENQLRTASYMVDTTQKKVESLEAENYEMMQRRTNISVRIDKMKLVSNVIDEAENVNERVSSFQKDKFTNDVVNLDFVMDSVRKMLITLHCNFSTEERKSLKFESMLIPTILTPTIDMLLINIDPFQLETIWISHLSSGLRKLCHSIGSIDEADVVRRMVVLKCIVPWVEKSLSSSKWDPVTGSESGLQLYEHILSSVQESFDDLGSESLIEENNVLKDSVNEEIIVKIVHPKLHRTLSHLKPKLDSSGKVISPMHLWILPWLPHFDHNLLGTLIDEVRRKLRSTLSLLGSSNSKDMDLFVSFTHLLLPWKKLLGDDVLSNLTSDIVTPRFARLLSRIKVDISPSQQDWSKMTGLFRYFDQGLMSVDDFVSLIEGEVLPVWANTLHSELKTRAQNINQFKDFYITWKRQLLLSSTQSNISHSSLVLQSEPIVCRYLLGGLEMIDAALDSNRERLDGLKPPSPMDCNYRITLMNRAKAKKANRNETFAHENLKVSQYRDGRRGAPFQEVVADFAKNHDMEFYPKMGSNSTKDGKPVFMLGHHPVYFDNNVIFALRGSSWQPISLEHLAQTC